MDFVILIIFSLFVMAGTLIVTAPLVFAVLFIIERIKNRITSKGSG
jgi:hypothetical protein